MATEYYKPSTQKIFGEIIQGLQKRLYREQSCRLCGQLLGWVNRAMYGYSIYCEGCMEKARVEVRRRQGLRR